jgi:hypothetical protein
MSDPSFVLSFRELDSAKANQYASELAAYLRDVPGVAVEQARDRPETQDFGATLVVILGTATATELANGIATWLKRKTGATIDISNDGHVVGENLDSRDAAKIAKAFSRRK